MKTDRDIIGYVIELEDCTLGTKCYLGIRGRIMPCLSQNKRILYSSIDDAKRYAQLHLQSKSYKIISVYEEEGYVITRLERTNAQFVREEKFELIERKRPQRMRKDPFRGKIPKLRTI